MSSGWISEATSRGAVHVLADGVSGSTWSDESTGPRDSTIVGATLVTASPPGTFANYLSFDGVDDHVSSSIASFGSTMRNFAYESVLRMVGSGTNQALSGVFNTFNNQAWHLMAYSTEGSGGGNKLDVLVRRASGTQSSLVRLESVDAMTALAASGWHHLVVSVDDAVRPYDVTVWVDGVAVTDLSVQQDSLVSDDFVDLTEPFADGARRLFSSEDKFAQVDIAARSLYPAGLTQTDVDALYGAAFAAGQTVNLGAASETDTANPATVVNPRRVLMGLLLESGDSLLLESDGRLLFESGAQITVAVGTAAESCSALSVTVVNPRTYTLGATSESDVANPAEVANPRSVLLAAASETDAANPATVVNPRTVVLGTASETDVANGLDVVNPRTYQLGQTAETSTAGTVTPAKTVTLGRAVEIDITRPVTIDQTAAQTILLGQASEVDVARPLSIVNPRTHVLGAAAEVDIARPVSLVLATDGTAVGEPTSTRTVDVTARTTAVDGTTATLLLDRPTTTRSA